MTNNQIRLEVKVAAGSATDGVTGWMEDTLKVRVRAPAERGKANKATIKVIAQALDIPGSTINIISGHTSPRKMIEIEGLSLKDVFRKLR